MASIIIRNLPEATKEALKRRAALNGRSMEAEARDMLSRALGPALPEKGLGTAIHQRFLSLDLPAFDLPEREFEEAPAADFSEH